MNSTFLKLNSGDFKRGLFVAVATPIIAALADALNIPGFDFVAYDWKALAMLGVTAGLGYIVKNLLSDGNGKVFGKIG
jgi:hypothetical protein